jgi:putative ABC transport system permease protein
LRAIPGTEFAGSLRLMKVVDAFITTISVVALVGTGLVVTNTLLMAIAERTREIGILMTVGWTPWLVLRMLLAESLVLCTAGAVLGNGFALLLLRVVNGLESVGFGWIPVRYPLSLAAMSLVMALAIALVALLWPAVVVFRMQPLDGPAP